VVEFGIKVNPVHRLAYLPKILVESLGPDLTVKPDSRVAIIYPRGEDLKLVVSGLRIILQSLELTAKRSTAKPSPGHK